MFGDYTIGIIIIIIITTTAHVFSVTVLPQTVQSEFDSHYGRGKFSLPKLATSEHPRFPPEVPSGIFPRVLLSNLFHASLRLFIDAVSAVGFTYPELDWSEARVVYFNTPVWHFPVRTEGKCESSPTG
jgi:hypothetical protein